MINALLTSSDHHANWGALEHWFKVANEKKVPFVINGDVVGDYNFEGIAMAMGLTVPEKYSDTYKHGKQLKELYKAMIALHAKKLADLIDKYEVLTVYLLGNHEPVFFCDLVSYYLKNKDLFIDLNSYQGVLNLNGVRVAGIPNTGHLQSYCYGILSEKELSNIFSHLRTERKLISDFDREKVEDLRDPVDDVDWIRIMRDFEGLDVFFTHGQIGRGSWRAEKHADETPTLLVAAKLSLLAKVTVDGHLHSSHKMKNAVGKPTIRAVGNHALLIEKDNDQIFFEDLKSDESFEAKKQLMFSREEFDAYKF
ncbi:metallophosphoesterase [Candidatus Woesearchaeota archaeon]|nr:metallophosphoesterase [Candidatus Woesearchaeota archaeon]